MTIDPSTLEAIKTVRTRTEFEQFTETFPEGTMAEIQEYVGAARHLADDIQRMHAVVSLQRPKVDTLDQAVTILKTVTNGDDPVTGTTLPGWPETVRDDTANHITWALVHGALPMIAAHATHLTATLAAAGFEHDVARIVADLYGRLLNTPEDSGRPRVQWLGWIMLATGGLARLVDIA